MTGRCAPHTDPVVLSDLGAHTWVLRVTRHEHLAPAMTARTPLMLDVAEQTARGRHCTYFLILHVRLSHFLTQTCSLRFEVLSGIRMVSVDSQCD
jgi:hypothetical protein